MKHPFEYQQPTHGQVVKINSLRDVFKLVYDRVLELTPISRERSLAIAKLREASMWANASIVFEENEVSSAKATMEAPEGFLSGRDW